jgi:hypothetical protein
MIDKIIGIVVIAFVAIPAIAYLTYYGGAQQMWWASFLITLVTLMCVVGVNEAKGN